MTASVQDHEVFLVGDRIALRPLAPVDCDGPYLRWFNDAEVCRYNSHHRLPYTREQALAYVAAAREATDRLVLAITEREGGRHVGNIALQQIEGIDRSAEFAIVIGARDVWGRGYGAEAGLLLLAHGFDRLNLHRIHCGTLLENHAMRRLAERLGMREEGRRREAAFIDGTYHDMVEYGVLRREFRTMVGAAAGAPGAR